MSKTSTVEFNPKQVTKALLSPLTERGREIVVERYGLGTDGMPKTLEHIGKQYDITRERVRQIENHSLEVIRSSDEYRRYAHVFEQLRDIVRDLGGVVSESDLLDFLSQSRRDRNHYHFLLVVGQYFKKHKEDEHFKHRWYVDPDLSDKIHQSLQKLYQSLSDDDLISEPDFIERFLEYLKDISEEHKKDEVVRRWLSLSKKVAQNPLGEWGRAQSPNVRAKGMRDYAFLVLRKRGEPVHFREVAEAIEEVFNRKAHVATTHNELIKDPRFVLVGRGLYALKEWGYTGGVVRDVIRRILEAKGPLTAKEIVSEVLKERFVRENTILVNLQNARFFRKDEDGRYSVVE